jgi:hypothetical protein
LVEVEPFTERQRAFLLRLAELQEEYGLNIAPVRPEETEIAAADGSLRFELPGYYPDELREAAVATCPDNAPSLGTQ